ncbi:sugar O-acetyltransferase [Microbacterium jejuense]
MWLGIGIQEDIIETDYFAGDDRTNYERMLAGDFYIADDPDIEVAVLRAVRLVREYEQAVVADDGTAPEILADLVGTLGEGVWLKPPLFVDLGRNIHIGARTFINSNLTALDVAAIRIGEDCQIGPNVQLLTPTHPIDAQRRRDKLEAAEPITIGDNVWLGGGVIVCPGVTIGDNTVVGAGAVVTRDLPANVLAVGNPARVIREFD